MLLLDPKNEEANYMLMEIELKRSNYSKVKELADNFSIICKKLCDKKDFKTRSSNLRYMFWTSDIVKTVRW